MNKLKQFLKRAALFFTLAVLAVMVLKHEADTVFAPFYWLLD